MAIYVWNNVNGVLASNRKLIRTLTGKNYISCGEKIPQQIIDDMGETMVSNLIEQSFIMKSELKKEPEKIEEKEQDLVVEEKQDKTTKKKVKDGKVKNPSKGK